MTGFLTKLQWRQKKVSTHLISVCILMLGKVFTPGWGLCWSSRSLALSSMLTTCSSWGCC